MIPETRELSLSENELAARSPDVLARIASRALTLQRISAEVGRSLEHTEVVASIVRLVTDTLGASAGAVTELSEDGTDLRLLFAIGYPESIVHRFEHVAVASADTVRRLIEMDEPVFIGSMAEFERLSPAIAHLSPHAAAHAALALRGGGRPLGALLMTFDEPREFSDDERDFLLVVAQHCAFALERARLYENERRARAEAETASTRLADALNSMTDRHFVLDAEWRYVKMNRAASDFFREAGFEPDQLIGEVAWERFPRLIDGDLYEAVHRAAAESRPCWFTTQSQYTNSWYEGSAYPVREGVAVYSRDVTERILAEREISRLNAALRQRVDEMETLLRVIPVGIGIASDPECRNITVNPASAAHLGITPSTNASKSGDTASILPFRFLVGERELAPEELPLQRAAREARTITGVEVDVERADGTRLTLITSAAPLLDEGGNVRGSVGASVDITQRKREENHARFLSDASAAFAATVDVDATLSDIAHRVVPALADVCVVFVRGVDGRVVPVATASKDRWIADRIEALEQRRPIDTLSIHPVHQVLRGGASVFVREASEEAMQAVVPNAPRLVALTRELGVTSMLYVPLVSRGRTFGVFSMATCKGRRLFDDLDLELAEELARRASMALDNARLLAAEHLARAEAETARAEAEAASRAKSEFLAVMSHELRTPLNAIAGYSELLELGLRGPVTPAQQADLRKIRQSQRHLLGLINSVLNFSRLDAGGVRYDITDVRVEAALGAVQSLIEPQLEARELSYRLESCDPRLTVRADAEKLQQVLLNLLGNAIKFTPPRGTIHLSCGKSETSISIHVADTGIGIAADKVTRIFEPFVQVDRTLSTTNDGVGLGLAISRDLARGMRGDLTVESRVGAGSVFTVKLPRGHDLAEA